MNDVKWFALLWDCSPILQCAEVKRGHTASLSVCEYQQYAVVAWQQTRISYFNWNICSIDDFENGKKWYFSSRIDWTHSKKFILKKIFWTMLNCEHARTLLHSFPLIVARMTRINNSNCFVNSNWINIEHRILRNQINH